MFNRSPSCSALAFVNSAGSVRVFHPHNGRTVILHADARDARAIAWSRDGLWLACGCRNDGIILHEMTYMLSDSSPADSNSGSKRSYRLKAHVHKITSVDFSHDSHLLASCSWDKSILVWGVHVRQQFARIELTAWPTALVWAPSRLLLACATMDSRVVVHLASLHFHPEFLHLSGATLAPVADLRAHQEGVWSLAWFIPCSLSSFTQLHLTRKCVAGRPMESGSFQVSVFVLACVYCVQTFP